MNGLIEKDPIKSQEIPVTFDALSAATTEFFSGYKKYLGSSLTISTYSVEIRPGWFTFSVKWRDPNDFIGFVLQGTDFSPEVDLGSWKLKANPNKSSQLEIYAPYQCEDPTRDLLKMVVDKYLAFLKNQNLFSNQIEIENSSLQDPDSKEAKIYQACKDWAARGYSPQTDMEEFRNDLYENTEIWLSEDQFKDYLREAGRLGLIRKVNGRWRPVENSL